MITKLTFDWQPHFDEGNGMCHVAEVGEMLKATGYTGVTLPASIITEITEHPAKGEGDKWYYDIFFEDMTVQRTFYPHSVLYAVDKDRLPF